MSAGRPNQSIHKVFAENLRGHCARFSSIAELCRMAGINRQQFNRYLSGQNLPNPRTLERLAQVLEVSEASLFASEGAAPATLPPGFARLAPLLEDLERQAQTDLRSGYYTCYAPLIGHSHFCLCMVLHIHNEGGVARFTRRTSFKTRGPQQPELAVGRHDGFILGDVNGALLIGRNRIFPNEFSAFRFQRPHASLNLPRAGMGLLRTHTADVAVRLALHYLGDDRHAAREALALMGVVELADPSIPTVVRTILAGQTTNGSGQASYVSAEGDAAMPGFGLDQPRPR